MKLYSDHELIYPSGSGMYLGQLPSIEVAQAYCLMTQ